MNDSTMDVQGTLKAAAEDVVDGDLGQRVLRAAEAIAELVTAAREYLAVSQPLSAQCEAAQTRMEHALSVFGGADPFVQAEEIRGLAGRIRELEDTETGLSDEVLAKNARLSRIRELLALVGSFATSFDGEDPIETLVAERVALLEAKAKSRKRGAK